jgi:replication factor C subunit 3/5
MTSIPWMEAYRPTNFEDIVLDPLNKEILHNIIETEVFPNLLFYGPPGTGKTTTIINLINAYQGKKNKINKDLVIHLNASDERGIDTIRNQINVFVNSKPLFNNGMKFVILDEVDYMTKNAQQAMRNLLQNYSNNVRFCLICNYISKIDDSLQNEFIKLRFNQLPETEIIHFLRRISDLEKLSMTDAMLAKIQKIYKSDIRSMINFMQSNQHITPLSIEIIDDETWKTLIYKVSNRENVVTIHHFINAISIQYNIDKKNIMKDFLNYIIRHHSNYITSDFLHFAENIIHSQIQNSNVEINYLITQLYKYIEGEKTPLFTLKSVKN